MSSYLGKYKYRPRDRRGYVRRVFAKLLKVHLGWPFQCRCGEMTVVKYRGRFYCATCGRRKRVVDQPLFEKYESLRERYEKCLQGQPQ